MKGLIFSCLVLLTAIATQAQSGRVRISFVGFECYRETWDDILHSDGKGDEVYFNFGFTLADKNGNTKQKYEKRTNVYGDATGQFSNRVSAGSWVNIFGEEKGGIKAGDSYRCNDIVGEYDMADGDILTVVPTAWEYDPIADNLNSFTSTMGGLYNAINEKVAPIMIGFHLVTGDLAGVVYHSANLGITKIKAGGDQGELGKAGTRPIGMEKYGDFSPQLVVLNTPNLTTISNSNFGFGNGIIAVNYDEVALGNNRDHGNYSILIKVEFMSNGIAPAPSAQQTSSSMKSMETTKTTTPAVSSPQIIRPTKQQPVANATINTQSTNLSTRNTMRTAMVSTYSVVGRWAGTQTNDYGQYPQNIAFELTSNNEFIISVQSTGAVVSSGTYSYSNGIISGSFKQLSSGETFSFTGSVNQSVQQISCTQGQGNSTTGQGKWVVSKN